MQPLAVWRYQTGDFCTLIGKFCRHILSASCLHCPAFAADYCSKSLMNKFFRRGYSIIGPDRGDWHEACYNSGGLLSSDFFLQDHNFNGYPTMQISNVISGLSDPTSWGKKGEAAVQTGASEIESIDSQVQTNSNAQKASADILRQYEITNITPTEFSQMIQKLYKAGAISDKNYQELSAVRGDLEKAGIGSDESVDMLEFYSNKLSKEQKALGNTLDEASRQQSLGSDKRRLDWMQKFAAIQANPDDVGLDVVA